MARASKDEGPGFVRRAASWQRVGSIEAGEDGRGRNELGPDDYGGRFLLTKFDGGVANASALLGETFEQFSVGMGKGAGRGREDFEDSGESVLVVTLEDGNDEDGADPEVAGEGGVDARVELGIDRKLGLMGFETGAGETVAGVKGDAEIRGEGSIGGTADHLVAAGESQGGGVGVDGFGGTDYERVEDEIESEVGWKTGEAMLLKRNGRVKRRLVRAELGPRDTLRKHSFLVPGSEASFLLNGGEVNWRRDSPPLKFGARGSRRAGSGLGRVRRGLGSDIGFGANGDAGGIARVPNWRRLHGFGEDTARGLGQLHSGGTGLIIAAGGHGVLEEGDVLETGGTGGDSDRGDGGRQL